MYFGYGIGDPQLEIQRIEIMRNELICNRVDFYFSCVLLLLHASIDLPVIRFAQKEGHYKSLEESAARITRSDV